MFSFFDGDVAGAAVTEPARGAEEIGFAREEAGFGVVEDEHIDAGKELEKAGLGDIDPEVHGVGDGEFWFLHLIENEVLEVGGDIPEENEGEFFVRGGELGFEIGEDIEIGGEGCAVIHVLFVAAVPAEGFALDDLEAGQIDISFFPDGAVVGGKIVADDTDEADGGVEASGESCERGGAAKEIGAIFFGGLHTVDADRSDDENAHGRRDSLKGEAVPSRERISRAAAVGSEARRR